MRYFEINTLGNDQDRSLAFADAGVQDLDNDGRLMMGDPVGVDYPADPRIYLQLQSPGLKLPSLLGNTAGYLILADGMKRIMEQFNLGAIELLPFSLYNHKKRLASKDYWIANPLGTFDCVDRRASKIKYLDGDPTQIVSVEELVLDPRKVAGAPDLFRVPEARSRYLVSERIPAAWHGNGFTNLYLIELALGA
jgi:hypothetical protein